MTKKLLFSGRRYAPLLPVSRRLRRVNASTLPTFFGFGLFWLKLSVLVLG
jgi:hypothetical protein